MTPLGWCCRCVIRSVRFAILHRPPESPFPINPTPKVLVPFRLEAVHKFLCTTLESAGGGSAQGWCHHRRIALPGRGDPAQSVHEPIEQTLLLVVIAVAHSRAACVAPDLGSDEQEA